jgi:hypothetical protein
LDYVRKITDQEMAAIKADFITKNIITDGYRRWRVKASATGWLHVTAAVDLCSKESADGYGKSAHPFRPKFNGSKVL